VTPTATRSGRLARILIVPGALVTLTIGITVALSTSRVATPPAQASELPAFTDCPELRRHMRELALPLVTAWGLAGATGGARDGAVTAMEGGLPPAAAAGAETGARSSLDSTIDSATGSGPTGTNVQEAGVDEPDLAKTDGRLVVRVTDGALHVVDAGGSQPRRRGTVSLPHQSASELLLLDGRALVVGHGFDAAAEGSSSGRAGPDAGVSSVPPADIAIPDAPIPLGRRHTVLTLVDLRDPGDPTVVGTKEVAGTYVSARSHDGVARVVLSSRPWLRFPLPTEPGGAAERKALARNRGIVTAATALDWLPAQVTRDAAGRVVSDGPLLGCSAVRHPVRPSGIGMLTVLTIDPSRKDALRNSHATAVVADGDLGYASTDRLYIATTVGGWVQPMTAVRETEDLRRTSTKVHAFDLTDRERAEYVASGTVDGYLLGRWAMSDHEGRLRVATTTGPPGQAGNRSQSSVVVLEERGRQLVRVGSVGGLGKGERIRAVRWFGDTAAVVTFRQTDPLYLVDISSPTRPRVLGELKVPGYSAYLHPLGNGLLLGVGQDADAEGRVKGLQLSVFDVSDPARPRRVDTLALGGTSPVEEDSRAFTYLPERRLAVLPLWPMPAEPVLEEERASHPVAVAVSVGEDGSLREYGRHGDDGEVLRVLPVGQRLAAVSTTRVSVLDPDGLRLLGSVPTWSR
jgi:hypothetical protein